MNRRNTVIVVALAATIAGTWIVARATAPHQPHETVDTTSAPVVTEIDIPQQVDLNTITAALDHVDTTVILDGTRTFQGETSQLRWEFHPDGSVKVDLKGEPHYIVANNTSYTYLELSDDVKGWEITPAETAAVTPTLRTVLGLDDATLQSRHTTIAATDDGYSIEQHDRATGKTVATVTLTVDNGRRLTQVGLATPDDHTRYLVHTSNDSSSISPPAGAVERGVLQRRYDQTPLGQAAAAVVAITDAAGAELMTANIADFGPSQMAQVLAANNLHYTIADTSSGLTTVGFHNDTTAVHIVVSDGIGHCRRAVIDADGSMDAEDTSGTTTSNGYTCTAEPPANGG